MTPVVPATTAGRLVARSIQIIRRLPRDQRIALACAAFAVTAAVLAIVATQGSLSTTALVRVSPEQPAASLVKADNPHFHLTGAADHYDGEYYYIIAHDPLASLSSHKLVDQAAYRYGHPLYGWLALCVAFYRPVWIPNGLFLVTLAAMGAAAWCVSRLAVRLGGSPWLGLLVPLSPGLLAAGSLDTPETLAAALAVGGLLAWFDGRWLLAGVVITLACFAKEQDVAVPVGLAVWELLRWRTRRAVPGMTRAKLAALAAGPVMLTGWYLYLHEQLHAWPFHYQSGNIGRPFGGWIRTFQISQAFANEGIDKVEVSRSSPWILMALGLLLLAASVKAARVRTVLDVPFLIMAGIVSCQGVLTLLFPAELLRTPSIAVLLAAMVLLVPRQKGLRVPLSDRDTQASKPAHST